MSFIPDEYITDIRRIVQSHLESLEQLKVRWLYGVEKINDTLWADVDQYGAIGDGTTDDSAAFTAAFAALGVTGGTVKISCQKKYLIDSNITVPAGCAIQGCVLHPGTLGDNDSVPYGNYGSVLIVNSSATVSLESSASLSQLIMYRKGMTFPAPNSDSYAGTAVEIGGDDAHVSNCIILGFAKAINSTGYQRVHCEYVYIDCTAGIDIDNCWDISYLDNCHCWPYATIETYKDGMGTGATATANRTGTVVSSITVTNGGATYPSVPLVLVRVSGGGGSGCTAHATILAGVVDTIVVDTGGTGYTSDPDVAITYDPIIEKSGTGFNFTNVADWARITNCFAYAHLNDFQCDDVNSVTFNGCGADSTTARGDRASAGFSINGTSTETRLIGCQAGGQRYGIYTNVTSAHIPSFINDCSVWSSNNGIYSADGSITVIGGTVRDCPAGIIIKDDDATILGVTIRGTTGYSYATNGVYVDGASSRVVVDGCIFQNISSSAIVNNATDTNLYVGTNTYENIGYKPVAQDAGDPWKSYASASTLTLPGEGMFFDISGTTTINTINSGWYGRVVILRFASSLTVNDGGSGALNLNGPMKARTGTTLTLVSRGYAEWYEVSRSNAPSFQQQLQAGAAISRSIGTTYQNNIDRTRYVSFSGYSGTVWAYLTAYSDANAAPTVAVAQAQVSVASSPVGFGFMVLPGNYYKIICSAGTPTMNSWLEWI